MRITHEADYAVRIIHVLAQNGETVSAREIAEHAGVTLRFTLKILNKLSADNVVTARKGAAGGYALAVPPEELALGRVIECIDGPFELNHCLSDEFSCTRVGDKQSCKLHRIFDSLNQRFKEELYSIKITDIIE